MGSFRFRSATGGHSPPGLHNHTTKQQVRCGQLAVGIRNYENVVHVSDYKVQLEIVQN